MGSRGSHNAGDQQKQPLHFSLENILNEDGDQAEYDIPKEKAEQGWDEEGRDREAAVGYCIECEGTCSRLIHYSLPFIPKIQINLLNSTVRTVQMTFVKSVLHHNIARVPENDMPQNLYLPPSPKE